MEDGTIVVGRARDVDTVRTTSKLVVLNQGELGCKSQLLKVSTFRVILQADLLIWRSVTATMNSGSYKDYPTELYFEDGHPTYKIKFSGAVFVAS